MVVMKDLSALELLTTTRTVRKRLDLERPVDLQLIRRCIEIAIQAPSASNSQPWHFVVVQDPGQRAELAKIYRRAFKVYRDLPVSVHALAEQSQGEQKQQMERIVDSATFLAENLERVPTLVIPCFEGRVDLAVPGLAQVMQATSYASILPAAWSFMLAGRLFGLGCALTTMHLLYERETAEVLGIPYERVSQACLLAVAHAKGEDFKPAPRKPVDEIIHVDDW
jgi:nitroreductase